MSERVLQEFATRLTRAKNLLETTKTQCGLLKRDAFKLEQVTITTYHNHKKGILKSTLGKTKCRANGEQTKRIIFEIKGKD